ncbi:hypothetical protein [[Phormidium] sp. ETS-05]|uniref:hypothetical protein n=1 Tax=[Phormidium] sp. ETS-05 TaxID=222819 RepID=UPI0018EED061|nr:hypothetical protein [[Phormidium] sp. ETS-05]
MGYDKSELQCSPDETLLAQLELLEALVLWDSPYPWNPAEPQAQKYLEALEMELMAQEEAAAVLAADAPGWLDRLENLSRLVNWDAMSSAMAVRESLQQKFEAVPLSWLEDIARKALELWQLPDREQAKLSPTERLVYCVLPLFPNWAAEDLQVLARPFAYAMRSGESALANIQIHNWQGLSDIEKARVSLAIAHYVISL